MIGVAARSQFLRTLSPSAENRRFTLYIFILTFFAYLAELAYLSTIHSLYFRIYSHSITHDSAWNEKLWGFRKFRLTHCGTLCNALCHIL